MQIQTHTKSLQALWVAESLPVLGVIPLAVTIFLKYVVFPFLSDETIQYYDCLNYLRAKTIVACFVHALPILGPIILRIWRDTFACMAIKNYPPYVKLFLPHDQEERKSVVLKLIESFGPEVFEHAGDDLRQDKDFIQSHMSVFEYAHPSLKKNREFAQWIIEDSPWYFKNLDDTIKNDEKLHWKALKEPTIHYDSIYRSAPLSLKKDREFVKQLLSTTVFYMLDLFDHIDPVLHKDQALFKEVMKFNGQTLSLLVRHKSPLVKDENFVMEMVLLQPDALDCVPDPFRNDVFFRKIVEKESAVLAEDFKPFFSGPEELHDFLVGYMKKHPTCVQKYGGNLWKIFEQNIKDLNNLLVNQLNNLDINDIDIKPQIEKIKSLPGTFKDNQETFKEMVLSDLRLRLHLPYPEEEELKMNFLKAIIVCRPKLFLVFSDFLNPKDRYDVINQCVENTPEILSWNITFHTLALFNLILSIKPFLKKDPSLFRYMIGLLNNRDLDTHILSLLKEIPELLLYCPSSTWWRFFTKTPETCLRLYKREPIEVLKIAKTCLPIFEETKKEFFLLACINHRLKKNRKTFLHKNPLTFLREHMFAIKLFDILEFSVQPIDKLLIHLEDTYKI